MYPELPIHEAQTALRRCQLKLNGIEGRWATDEALILDFHRLQRAVLEIENHRPDMARSYLADIRNPVIVEFAMLITNALPRPPEFFGALDAEEAETALWTEREERMHELRTTDDDRGFFHVIDEPGDTRDFESDKGLEEIEDPDGWPGQEEDC